MPQHGRAASDEWKRRSWRDWWHTLSEHFGYDFFVSYARKDGAAYSTALDLELSEAGYSCFFDRRDMPLGQSLKESSRRALKRSQMLLFVGTPAAFESDHVYEEVLLFGTARPATMLNLANTVGETSQTNRTRILLGDRTWIDERGEVIPSRPTAEVVSEVKRAFKFVRRRTQRLIAASIVGFALCCLVMYTVYAARDRSIESAIAESRSLAANAESLRTQGRGEEAVDFGVRAVERYQTTEAQFALGHAVPHEVLRIHPADARLQNAAFSVDGRAILTYSPGGSLTLLRIGFESQDADKAVQLWSAASGKLLATLRGHTGTVAHAGFSPDGQWVATASRDQTARIWRVADGESVWILKGHSAALTHVEFSQDSLPLCVSRKMPTATCFRCRGTRFIKVPGRLS
jgi:hypothetical protein